MSRYGQLARQWRGRIVEGAWPAGQALPSENDLAREAGVALGTARQALALLVTEGLLQRVQGRGTFVTRGLAHASMLRFFRFGGDAGGDVPGSRVIERRVVRAQATQAERLGLQADGRVLRLQRLRLIGGRPVLFETLWLPLPLFEPLVALPLSQWDDLLYPMYSQRCGVTIRRASDDLSFAEMPAAAARHLSLDDGAPAVRVDRLALDLADRCVELRTTFGDARAFRYRADIQ